MVILELELESRGLFIGDFLVQVELHQGSVLNSLSFIIMLETLSRENNSGCCKELFHAGDLVLVSATLKGLKGRLEA